jgi:LysM repeat protein
MTESTEKKTLVIGGREVTMIVIALAMVSLAMLIFALGAARFRQRAQVADMQSSQTPTSVIEGAGDAFPTPVTPTFVIAATMVPTPESIQHTVQADESLISISILYGVELQALLSANGLTETSVILPGQVLNVPLVPGNEGAYHTVQDGEALAFIAAQYGVTVEAIQQANNLPNADSIYVGQELFIPGADPVTATAAPDAPTALPTPTSAVLVELQTDGPVYSEWPRSKLDGHRDDNYPLTHDAGRFTIHYQPTTYAEQNLDEIITLATNGLNNAEAALAVQLEGRFDLYVAGTLFEYPNASLRGISESRERRIYILHDGSGTPADNAYFFTHEITHLVAWNTWGQPSTAMLSEGLATWVGRSLLEEGGYLTYSQFCEGIYDANRMASMANLHTDFQAFNGHIRDPFNYFGSACFVGHLIDIYGLQKMSQLYHTSDYSNIYGKSIGSLDVEWQDTLAAKLNTLTIDSARLNSQTLRVSEAYAYIFSNYNESETLFYGYAAVDRARVALWKGDFDEVDRWLAEFTKITGFRT